MRRHCNGLRGDVPFTCADAPAFANFHIEAYEAVRTTLELPQCAASKASRDGIVMVVYPKLLASAYASIRVLRDVLDCDLPIEIWYHVDEIGTNHALLAPLRQLSARTHGVSFRTMDNPRTRGFLAKIFAINHSKFERVLFLDTDNVPVRDPRFLFNSPKFVDTGAVFWPDYWHPRRTLFNLHDSSMLWELLDIPYVDMFEQESGQLLLDRTRHAAALALVNFYAFHEPNFFERLNLVYGGLDQARRAFPHDGDASCDSGEGVQ